MEFKEIQLFEYALNTFVEMYDNDRETPPTYSIVFTDNNDVFKARSLTYNNSNQLVFYKNNEKYPSFIEKKSFNVHNNRSLLSIREDTYEAVQNIETDSNDILNHKNLLIELIKDIINGKENPYEATPTWFEYKSLKHNYELDFKLASPKIDYQIISLQEEKSE